MSCGKQHHCTKDGNFEVCLLDPEHSDHFCKYCINIGKSVLPICIECQKEGNCNYKEDHEIIRMKKVKNLRK